MSKQGGPYRLENIEVVPGDAFQRLRVAKVEIKKTLLGEIEG